MACIHHFELLEPARANSKKVWIFYCKKCLELREVVKNPDFHYDSDSPKV